MMMDSYFQMLIPITVPDARAIDPPFQIDHFDLIPDMKPSAENVYSKFTVFVLYCIQESNF